MRKSFLGTFVLVVCLAATHSGYAAITGISGEGTSASPYLIGSADDWNTLASYMSTNKDSLAGNYIQLTADIDFTGDTKLNPLGYEANIAFCGDLDGNGKSIKIASVADTTDLGETISWALITYTDTGANIHDLTLEGSYSTEFALTGALVGALYNGTISNVTSNLTVTSSGDNVGGLTGYSLNGTFKNCIHTGTFNSSARWNASLIGYADSCVIAGCVNKGTVTSTTSYTGGVAAYVCNYSTVSDCYNDSTGTVSGKGYVAGVIASLVYSSVADNLANYGTVAPTGGNFSGGVISYVRYYVTVKNCVNYGTVSATASYTGGVIGYVASSTLSNCYNYGDVTSSGYYLAGVICNPGAGCDISDCGNYGTVTYTGTTANCYVAGAISRAYSGNYCRVFNEGTVTVDTTKSSYVAGLIGYLYESKSYVFEDCYNTADIKAFSNVAGLIANVNTTTLIEMTGCYNTGNITSKSTASSTYPTAGLIAYYPKGSTFTNCWNSGIITSSGNYYTGGLFGARKGSNSSSYPIAVSGCYNTGEIIAEGTHSGGIFGYLYTGYTTVDSCYNTGNITGEGNYVGGIAGYMSGTSVVISNCYNTGNLYTGGGNVAGIAGYNNTADTIYNCFNTGSITSATIRAAGIVAYSPSVITNVYNSGAISGTTTLGGIIGQTIAAKTVLTNAYNTGVVSTTATGSTYGNIVGINTTNTTYWTEDNSMSGAYYLTANTSDDMTTDTLSTGLSYAELAKLDLGDDWTTGDNYTYPRITTIADNDYAKAYAAAVVPAEGDSYSSITTGFNVGTPDGVTWTASSGSVEIDGNNVTFSESYSGTLTMTATSGNVSVATELTCNVVVSGISDITGGDREMVEERFYNLSGAQIAEPEDGAKAIYIVVKTYDDGTSEAVKEIR